MCDHTIEYNTLYYSYSSYSRPIALAPYHCGPPFAVRFVVDLFHGQSKVESRIYDAEDDSRRDGRPGKDGIEHGSQHCQGGVPAVHVRRRGREDARAQGELGQGQAPLARCTTHNNGCSKVQHKRGSRCCTVQSWCVFLYQSVALCMRCMYIHVFQPDTLRDYL